VPLGQRQHILDARAAIAQELVPEIEARIRRVIGADRARELRNDLEAIRRDAAP
jgi:hypothetical protein